VKMFHQMCICTLAVVSCCMRNAASSTLATDPVHQSAGLLLRLLRLYAGVEQQRLAARLGVSQPTISRWELGRGGPGQQQLAQWLMLCQVALQTTGRPAFDSAWFNRAVAALQSAYGYGAGSAGFQPASQDGRADAADRMSALQAADELRQLGLTLLGASQPQPGQPRSEADTRLGSPLTAGRRPLALLPLYADIAAGLGEAQEARAAERERLEVPGHLLDADPGAYALRVSGDSMLPLLQPGDVVVVSPAAELYDGCLCAAYVEPDGDVVKRLQLIRGKVRTSSSAGFQPAALDSDEEDTAKMAALPEEAGPEALLLPLNPAYPAIRIGGDSGRDARIWGRVVFMQREL
jgi:SOS-response transcriptional repressor LexA/DNA-binding transcriptional regulator YiaG